MAEQGRGERKETDIVKKQGQDDVESHNKPNTEGTKHIEEDDKLNKYFINKIIKLF